MPMGKFYFLLLSAIFLSFFTSCKKEQSIPSYIYIPEIKVESIYNVSGSSSSRITNVKVFDGSTLIGVYELPVQVPILKSGELTIQCLALIENNGLTSNILAYPFYTPSLNELFLEEDRIDTIQAIVSYLSSSSADYWFEDFNGIGFGLNPGPNSNANLEITEVPSEVFEGSGSGKFDLESDTAYSKYLTNEYFEYKTGEAAFLELDHMNNQAFFFSLILRPNGGDPFKLPLYQFNSTANSEGVLEWNKIYIDIATSLNSINGLDNFEICFEMARNVSISEPIVLIDNVKVIRGK